MSYELQDPTTPRLPCPLVDNPNFKYVPASSTDIMKRFREMAGCHRVNLNKENQNENNV